MAREARMYRERRDLEWYPERTSLGWAALGGFVASLVIGVPMHALGMLAMGPAQLIGSTDAWAGWAVHLLAGILFAAPYGALVHTRDASKGALYGGLYGLAVGMLFAWLALFAILGMPLFGAPAAIDVLLHVFWGVLVGVVTAWGLSRTGEARPARRRVRVA